MREKTYKREAAGLLFILFAAMLVWAVLNPDARWAVELIVWPVFGFGTTAFGMDAIAKQIMGKR